MKGTDRRDFMKASLGAAIAGAGALARAGAAVGQTGVAAHRGGH
jgi:hypothetical protein